MNVFPIMKKVPGVGIQLAGWCDFAATIQGAVLCIHGLSANLQCWSQIAASLRTRHPLLAMDLRGRGHSDQPPTGYCLATHVEDIRWVLDALKIERITLMGHSLGAYISLAFAAAYPERMDRLLLVDGGGDLPPEQWERVNQAIKPALTRLGKVFPSFEEYVAPLKNSPLFQPWTETLESYFRYEIIAVDGGVRSRIDPACILEESENLAKADIASLYSKVACPTLIMRATEGLFIKEDVVLPIETAEHMVRQIPQARLFDVAGTNHYSIVFYPHAGRDQAIADFLVGQ
ncbi:MAG: alpha/beta hydrolase [Deltaproteobacteria bacterium]|nr:alpha/beta hydrolase [Deltaproteobacteria bacterium]